jgi:hypothetical protein
MRFAAFKEGSADMLELSSVENGRFPVLAQGTFIESAEDQFFTDIVPTRHLAVCFDIQAVAHQASRG